MARHASSPLLRSAVLALDGPWPRAPGPGAAVASRCWSGWSVEGVLVGLVEAGSPFMGEPCVSG